MGVCVTVCTGEDGYLVKVVCLKHVKLHTSSVCKWGVCRLAGSQIGLWSFTTSMRLHENGQSFTNQYATLNQQYHPTQSAVFYEIA